MVEVDDTEQDRRDYVIEDSCTRRTYKTTVRRTQL